MTTTPSDAAAKNEYQCFMCKGIFEKEWSDEEAEKEYQQYFPNVQDERIIVCEYCFNKVHPKNHPIQVALANLQTPDAQ